jgi:hypothetical protein
LEATARGSASVASIMRRSLALSPHYPRRPRNRSCDSITDNSSCARFKPARALSELRLRSLSIRRSAAATRSRARSKSATVYCGGSRRVRFFLGPFVTLLARTAALSRVPVAIVPFRFSTDRLKHIRRGFVSPVGLILGCMDPSRPPLVVAFELSQMRKAIVADALAGASAVVSHRAR